MSAFLCMICTDHLHAAIIGSDTAVDKFTTQQLMQDGDRIASFAALNAGFKLVDQDVSVQFDSYFPISGNVEFNGGTFTLLRDLKLQGPTIIQSLGNIYGNHHTFDLASTITCLSSPEPENSCEVRLLHHTTSAERIFALDWSFDSAFVSVGLDGRTATTDTVANYKLDGSSFTLVDESLPSNIDVYSLRWHPSDYFIAVGRGWGATSERLVVLQVQPDTGAMTQVSSANLNGYVYGVAWHPTGSYLAVSAIDSAAELQFFPVDGNGILNEADKLSINITPNRYIMLDALSWHPTGQYIAVGTTQTGAEATLLVYAFNDQPTLQATIDASVNTGRTVYAVDWNPIYTDVIAVGLLEYGTGGQAVKVYRHDDQAGTLTQIASITDLDRPALALDWSPDGNCLAVGRYFGNDEEVRTYAYDDVQGSLQQINAFASSGHIFSVRWSPDGRHLATGDYNKQLSVYQSLMSLADDTYILSDLSLALHNDLVIKRSNIILSGDVTIHGNGHELSLHRSSTLYMEPHTQLLFKDIILTELSDDSLQALDSSVTMSFDDATIYLDGSLSCTTGTLAIVQTVDIAGDGVFNFQSSGTCLINKFSQLKIHDGVTFNYDPDPHAVDLLHMVDKTSILYLNGGRLHASGGLRLTKGSLVADHHAHISNDATTEQDGISFGNSVSSEDNCTIQIPGNLEITKGFVVNNNV